METAKCASQEELEDVMAQRFSRAAYQDAELKEQLVLNGDGLPLDDLEAEAEDVDLDSISGELTALEQEPLI